MSTQLAPYDTAMRIGSGFNSYTQQLCINDAVVKDNKRSGTESDLRVVPNDSNNVSQIVKWTAKFVDTVSEVTDAMNISGSLEIKCGTIGGSGKGAYINTEKMKTSDINYFIQVKVTNQKLIASDVTKFNAIANAPATRFTDIYGDSFISGFIEGGEFNALLSIKLSDSSNKSHIMAGLELNLEKGGVGVKAKAEGTIEKEDIAMKSTTSIEVSWSGGGEIREKKDEEWTLENMKRAAIGFADKVAKCPQRTHAILTKYTALRTYQELTNKGTPLDYENAGVYTNSLLDAYMDYKEIWKLIQLASYNVNLEVNTLEARSSTQELVKYAEEAQQNFDKQLKEHQARGTDEKAADGFELVKHEAVAGKPLKPNALQPYPATLIGLEAARRDCRWEMIKIVKEVDAVTIDPNVATDPNRIWQYLSPVIFRQLLPTIKVLPPLPTREEMAAEKKRVEYITKDLESSHKRLKEEVESSIIKEHELDAKSRELQSAHEQVEAATTKYKDLERQQTRLQDDYDMLIQGDDLDKKKAKAQEERLESLKQEAASAHVESERLIQERDDLQVKKDKAIQERDSHAQEILAKQRRLDVIEVDLISSQKTAEATKISKDELQGSYSRLLNEMSALKIERDTLKAERDNALIPVPAASGIIRVTKRGRNESIDSVIEFPALMTSIPRIIYGLATLDSGQFDPRTSCNMREVTKEGFAFNQYVGQGYCYDLNTSWLTLPDNGIHFETGTCETWTMRTNDHDDFRQDVRFLRPFSRTPIVRCFFQSLSIGGGWRSLRVFSADVNANGFSLRVSTWAGRQYDGAQVGWLAYDADEHGKRVKSDSFVTRRNETSTRTTRFPGQPFSKTPALFLGVQEFDFGNDKFFRMKSDIREITKESVTLEVGTWDDSNMDHLQCDWIAIE